MVQFRSLSQTGIPAARLVFLISYFILTNSQMIPSAPSPPTLANCGPSLLPLVPCAPFVQGQSPEPSLQCCQVLVAASHQNIGCLCLFLNGSALASLPINSTRALQLPGRCSIQIDDPCSASGGSSTRPATPASQVSFKRNPTTSIAGAPTVTIAPRPSTVRFGMGSSSAYKPVNSQFGILAATSLVLAYLVS